MKQTKLILAFLQIPIDIFMILISFVIAYHFRTILGDPTTFYNVGLKEYLKYGLILLPFWLILFAYNGLYSIKQGGLLYQLSKIIVASSTAILLLIVYIFVSKLTFFSRFISIFTWIFSILAIFVGRSFLKLIQISLVRNNIGKDRVLLVGNNSVSAEVGDYLVGDGKTSGYVLVGVLNTGESVNSGKFKTIGDISDLERIIKEEDVDEVILTDTGISRRSTIKIVETCSDLNVIFKYIPDVLTLVTSRFAPGFLGSFPVMESRPILLDGWGRISKRLIDIIFSAILLIILSPVFLIVALLVKLTSKGPFLYAHERVGRDEKPFLFYKFRSMYIEKCDYKGGVYWTTKKDEQTRITPFGKILRHTNLDELPQLWNILIGDMSFVGPRPELPKIVQKFEQEIPEYFKRHKVKAGLTGWAQVNGLKGDTSISERVEHDIYYIENWSLWFDFKIILKTISLVISEAINGKSEYRTRP